MNSKKLMPPDFECCDWLLRIIVSKLFECVRVRPDTAVVTCCLTKMDRRWLGAARLRRVPMFSATLTPPSPRSQISFFLKLLTRRNCVFWDILSGPNG